MSLPYGNRVRQKSHLRETVHLTKDGIDENAAKEIIDYIKNLYGIESSE